MVLRAPDASNRFIDSISDDPATALAFARSIALTSRYFWFSAAIYLFAFSVSFLWLFNRQT